MGTVPIAIGVIPAATRARASWQVHVHLIADGC